MTCVGPALSPERTAPALIAVQLDPLNLTIQAVPPLLPAVHWMLLAVPVMLPSPVELPMLPSGSVCCTKVTPPSVERYITAGPLGCVYAEMYTSEAPAPYTLMAEE